VYLDRINRISLCVYLGVLGVSAVNLPENTLTGEAPSTLS